MKMRLEPEPEADPPTVLRAVIVLVGLVGIAVAVGAALQRISGMGVGLIAALILRTDLTFSSLVSTELDDDVLGLR